MDNLLQILPNLSVGVVAILSLVYVSKEFLAHLKEQNKESRIERQEREIALREVEKEVRTTITTQLSENTRVIERAIAVLDRK